MLHRNNPFLWYICSKTRLSLGEDKSTDFPQDYSYRTNLAITNLSSISLRLFISE